MKSHLCGVLAVACTLTWVVAAQAAITATQVGMVDIVADYGANPAANGNDDAPKIRNAIRDVTDPSHANYGKTIYFPSGTYEVHDKILAEEQDRGPEGCGDHRGRGTVVMVGSTKGSRPVLKLKNNTFTGATTAMLEIRNRHPEQSAACGFRNGLRGIDINLGSGNTSAVGLKFDAAQDSFLEDVKVIAEGTGVNNEARAGIVAVPGRGMAAANIEVVGGKIGMDLQDGSIGASFVGITLTGQSVSALTWNGYRGTSITGLKIEMANTTTATTAIVLGAADKQSGYAGHLSLYDASITFLNTNAQNPRIAISNPDNRAVLLTNVYTKNAKVIVRHGAGGAVDFKPRSTAAQPKEYVKSFAYAPRFIPAAELTGVYRIEGVTIPVSSDGSSANDPAVSFGSASANPPGDLLSQHLWKKTPSFTDSDVKLPISTTHTGDAWGAIQTAINNAPAGRVIYLPAGTFDISAPITLKANTTLVGVPGLRTALRPVGWTETTGRFVIETDAAPNGKTLIQDIAFDTPDDANGVIGGMHWRAGRQSIVRRVRTLLNQAHVETEKIDFLIDGDGGGRWYSLADHTNIPVGSKVQCNYRKLLVSGTSQALTFYGLDLERGGTKKNKVQYPMGELRGAKNVRVFGQKMEIDGAEVAAPDGPQACDPKRSDQPTDKGIAWDINGATDNVFFALAFSTKVSGTAPMFRVAPTVTRIALEGVFVQGSPALLLLRDEKSASLPPEFLTLNQWLGRMSRGTVNHDLFDHAP